MIEKTAQSVANLGYHAPHLLRPDKDACCRRESMRRHRRKVPGRDRRVPDTPVGPHQSPMF